MFENIEVRRARESDIVGLIELLESVASEGRWIATEMPVDQERRASRFRETLSRKDAAVFVAVAGDAIVGELGMHCNWPGLCELGMAIEAPWRGKGLGSRLVEAAIVWARSTGAHKISLDVFPHNVAAIALYEKVGFLREGHHPRHLRRKTGELWDVISMGLVLDVAVPPEQQVWYAGYGSNLRRNRFECYIAGGNPQGSKRSYTGCRDKRSPRDDRPIPLQHDLYFAEYSKLWNGSVAFINSSAGSSTTYGRMYLITYEQLNDVVLQENARNATGSFILPPFEQLALESEWLLPNIRLYGRLRKIGCVDGTPVLTFTATNDGFKFGAPSEAYVKMIVAGLQETYPALTKAAIRDYLLRARGIRGAVSSKLLSDWIATA